MSQSPDDYARELAQRNATSQYRPMTDESEAASGDEIVYADESEWMDEYDDEDCEPQCPDECPACGADLKGDGYPIGHQDPATGNPCPFKWT